MKSDQLYQNLLELAEKLDITVSEQNLRKSGGINVKSGLCKVKGKMMFIMSKHKSIRDKVELLAKCLSQMQIEDVYIVPAVRELLDKYKENDQQMTFDF
ncbi:MAG: hypothetical protein HN379_06545 [Desulfobacteraceae bacterium]|jgi:hypothetical protein|nr:hypothetical protein [Desulfobacteraceae bacterium]MBT4365601.1 hypothetical protein [Desulfobacteraceae bacterium]